MGEEKSTFVPLIVAVNDRLFKICAADVGEPAICEDVNVEPANVALDELIDVFGIIIFVMETSFKEIGTGN